MASHLKKRRKKRRLRPSLHRAQESTVDRTANEASIATEDTPPATPEVDETPACASATTPPAPAPRADETPAEELPFDSDGKPSELQADETRTDKPLSEESTDMKVVRSIEARTLEEADAEADRDVFEFPLPPSDGFEVDGVTLEHCAAVRAAVLRCRGQSGMPS